MGSGEHLSVKAKAKAEIDKKRGLKRCPKCKLDRSLDSFYSDSIRVDRLVATCKACTAGAKMKRKYGITFVEKESIIVDQQGGVCAGCLKQIDLIGSHTDHCHRTGRLRGVLCRSCNVALGFLQDDRIRLLRLANYLLHYENDIIEEDGETEDRYQEFRYGF